MRFVKHEKAGHPYRTQVPRLSAFIDYFRTFTCGILSGHHNQSDHLSIRPAGRPCHQLYTQNQIVRECGSAGLAFSSVVRRTVGKNQWKDLPFGFRCRHWWMLWSAAVAPMFPSFNNSNVPYRGLDLMNGVFWAGSHCLAKKKSADFFIMIEVTQRDVGMTLIDKHEACEKKDDNLKMRLTLV